MARRIGGPRSRATAAHFLLAVVALAVLAGCDDGLLDAIKDIDDEYQAGLVAPAAPGAPQLTPANGQLGVAWAAVPGAVAYDVYWSETDDPAAIPTANLLHTATTSASITGLANGIAYYVWVKASNAHGVSPLGPSESGIPVAPLTVPNAPPNVVVTPGDHQISVSWGAVTGATGYTVYWSPQNDTATIPGANLTNVDVLNAVIIGLENDIRLYVWVKARNEKGYSGFSLYASGTPVPQPPAMPGAPTLVAGNQQISASWASVTGSTSYDVFWNENDSAEGASTKNVTTTSTAITGLTNGHTYYIWLKAKNSGGSSDSGPSASKMPLPPIPATPTIQNLTPADRQLTVQWTSVTNAASYDVYWNDDDSTTGASVKNETGLSSVITGLTNGTIYYVWLKAKNMAGSSDFSLSANALPLEPNTAPDAPGAPDIVAGVRQLTITWTAVARATSYYVYWNNDSQPSESKKILVTDPAATLDSSKILQNGIPWYVWLKARNSYGDSGFGSYSSATPLAVPEITSLTMVVANQLNVGWSASLGAASYEIWWHTENTPLSIPSGNNKETSSTTTTVTGLESGTTYYVWVKGVNAKGKSTLSDSWSGITIPAVPAAPALTEGDEQLSVDWQPIAGATSYDLHWHTTNYTPPSNPSINIQNLEGTSATILSLTNRETYYVWVRARNASGASGFSPSSSEMPFRHVSSVRVDPDSASMKIGDSLPLGATVGPSGANDPSLTWTSDNEGVATVNASSGNVSAHAAGTATITATSNDVSTKHGTCVVTVLSNAKAITAFSFVDPDIIGETIDEGAKTITAAIPYSKRTKLSSSLVVNFTASAGATVKVGSTDQVSGATANNFTSTVTYTVLAEDRVATQNYAVTVSIVMGEGVIGIEPNPNVTVSFSGMPATWVRGGDPVMVTAVTKQGETSVPVDSYQWSINGVDIGGEINPTFYINATRVFQDGSNTITLFVVKNGYVFSCEAVFTVLYYTGDAGCDEGRSLAYLFARPSVCPGPRMEEAPLSPPGRTSRRAGRRYA
jgi:uncharacterized protein YjdB